jgi:hypothetical protein
MYIENLAERIANEFSLFTSGVRVIQLIDRSKNDDSKKSLKFLSNSVFCNFDQFMNELMQGLRIQDREKNPDLRLYMSVNSRCFEKAVRDFKRRQIDVETHGLDSQLGFYRACHRRFVSCLMVPANRDTRHFMLDVDTKEIKPIVDELGSLGVSIIKCYETPNGYHVITEPFNPNIFSHPDVEIKKDGMLLLNCYEP